MNESRTHFAPLTQRERPPAPKVIGSPPIHFEVQVSPVFKNSNRQDNAVALLAGLILGIAAALILKEDDTARKHR